MKTLGVLRWTMGAVVFVAAAAVFGQMASESRVAPVPSRLAARLNVARLTTAEAPKYSAVPVGDQEVQTALQFALTDQRRKNRSAVKLLSVLAAERQSASGANLRLCLSVDRHGRADSARVVVHRTEKDQWSVTLWAWGACPSTPLRTGPSTPLRTSPSTLLKTSPSATALKTGPSGSSTQPGR